MLKHKISLSQQMNEATDSMLWRQESALRRGRLLSECTLQTSVNDVLVNYHTELTAVENFNKQHDENEQIPLEFTTKCSLFIRHAILHESDDKYLFEAPLACDLSDQGMVVLLNAFIQSIPHRDKPVSLNLSQYLLRHKKTTLLDTVLFALEANKSGGHLLNISDIWLSGHVLPAQLQRLMQLLGGSSIQTLHLNHLLNVNCQHMNHLALGLVENYPSLCQIDLENWRKSEVQDNAAFTIAFCMFLAKLELHCDGLFNLSFASNDYICSEHVGIVHEFERFSANNPACEVLAPQLIELKKRRGRPRSYCIVEDSTSPINLEQTSKATTTEAEESVPSVINYGFFSKSIRMPWIEQQKNCDAERILFDSWLRHRKIKSIRCAIRQQGDACGAYSSTEEATSHDSSLTFS